MAVIAYAHDGKSVYDTLFLEQLTKHNTVYLLTFNQGTCLVPKAVKIVKMREPTNILFKDNELIEGPIMYVFFLLRAFLFWLQLNRLKPDIVLGCMATKYGLYTAIARSRPFVLIVWGSDVLIAPKRFFLSRSFAKYSLKKADVVVLDSEVQKDAVIELGCNADKILKFPWFDIESVRPKISKSKLRKQLGWYNNPIVINTRGHETVYDVQCFIEAIPQVIGEVPESRFLIIGEGHLTSKLKARVKELQLERYVMFVGRVLRDDVFSYLNASNVYVSTSLSDGTSASLLEAMTLKVSPVVTNIPGNVEWIEDGLNGYLVPVKDPQKLAEKLTLLLKDENLRQEIGERAFKMVRTKVSWDKNSMVLGNLISRLAGENR
jgi:glycosyltransferase involved in cell wall biosynthesis